MKVNVRNMTSSRGNPVPNQFIITIDTTTYFQSYDTIIVRQTPKGITLDRDAWNYSVTTGRYRNQFLGETIAETRKKIADGTYRLANLNK